MRMWNVDVKKMCRKHLLGEHVEMHMFVGFIQKGKSIQGFLDNQLVEVHNIIKRHEELKKEMIRRGYKHNSPIKKIKLIEAGFVDKKLNLKELCNRCKECGSNIR